jgi:hypothetical protein
VLQFVFILGRHDDQVGNVSEVGQVEQSVVGWPVFSHDPSSIEGEQNRKILKADVLLDLIVRPLKEGRIDRHDRLHPFEARPAAK